LVVSLVPFSFELCDRPESQHFMLEGRLSQSPLSLNQQTRHSRPRRVRRIRRIYGPPPLHCPFFPPEMDELAHRLAETFNDPPARVDLRCPPTSPVRDRCIPRVAPPNCGSSQGETAVALLDKTRNRTDYQKHCGVSDDEFQEADQESWRGSIHPLHVADGGQLHLSQTPYINEVPRSLNPGPASERAPKKP